jgi:uncharacterized protein (DUF924 family)
MPHPYLVNTNTLYSTPDMVPDKRIREVLDFWFASPGAPEHNRTRAVWFKKDDTFDSEIRRRFGGLIDEALTGRLDSWRDTVEGTVAYIVVLDQFTRNVHRGTPKSFAGDPRALAAARETVAAGVDRDLPGVWRQFVYLPFEHAEDLVTQEESVRLFRQLAHDVPEVDIVTYAERHHAVIARFGRFPHRNAILGRQSTPEEEAFLREPGSSF